MSTLPEQFSAASKAQIEAQLDFFQSLGARAFDGAARLVALNFSTGRAAVDGSSAALKQLAGVRDPRDLMALAQAAPQDFDKVMHYGREWFSIVSDVQAGLLKPACAALAPVTVAAPPAAVAAVVASVATPVATPVATAPAAPVPAAAAEAAAPEAAAVDTAAAPSGEPRTVKASKKPVVAVKPEAASAPVAPEKPIARAAGKVAGVALDATPSAATLVESTAQQILPNLKPVEATPPPAVFHQALLTPKRSKKR